MMRVPVFLKLACLLVALSGAVHLYGQDANWRKSLKQQPDDFRKLSWLLSSLKTVPAGTIYEEMLDEAIVLAEKVSADTMDAELFLATGRYHQRNGQLQLAWNDYRQARTIFLKHRLINRAGTALYNECIVLLSQGLGDSLVRFINSTEPLVALVKDPTMKLYLRTVKPMGLQTAGKKEEALKEFQQLVQPTLESNDTSLILSLYINIGMLQPVFDSTMMWYKKALDIAVNSPDKQAELLLKIGARYTLRDDALKDSALYYFLEAEKRINDFYSPVLKIQTENYICDFFMTRSEYKLALPYLHKAYAISKNVPGKTANIILHNLAMCHIRLNQEDSARYYLEAYKQKIDEMGDDYQFMMYHHTMGNFIKLTGDSCSYEVLMHRNKALMHARNIGETRVVSTLISDAVQCLMNNRPDKRMLPLVSELRAHCAYFHPLIREEQKLYAYSGFLADYARLESRYGSKDTAIARYEELVKVVSEIEAEEYQLGHNEAVVKYKSDLKDIELRYNQKKNTLLTAGAVLLILIIAGIVVALYKTHKLNTRIRLQNEELARLNHIKDRLFSVIGHDLRAPVSSLLSMVQLMEQGNLTPEKSEQMSAELKNKLGYTAGLMDNLLNWAHTQMQGYKPEMINVKLDELAREVIELLQSEASRKQISIQNNIPDGSEVYADVNITSLLMRNLLSNAIKFTPPGRKIEMEYLTSSSGRGFKIQDFGVGLSKEIIQEFNNPHSLKPVKSTWGTRHEKGTGIGLMLCKSFAQLMGGSIRVSSEKGKGTHFMVWLH